MASPQPISHPPHRGPIHPQTNNNFHQAVSPPSKEQLKSWWKGFGRGRKERPDEQVLAPQGIFGVPLAESIRYANVAISLNNDQGESFVYGFVPIVVAKCGVFLKEKATDVEGIFRLSGSAKRIKDLQQVFNTPDRYGKGLDWTGYTVHDAANILRRYLNLLPEPIVPLESYERFRQPLRDYQANNSQKLELMEAEEHAKTVRAFKQLITELPPLNRQLLLYILDLLAVFASKSELNRMNAQNLAAIFQPGIISHPKDDMAPSEYRLSQDVLIFLIENQDHFLIGMSGTAMGEDEKDKVKSAAPSVVNQSATTVDRSTSNASAGADSLRKSGGLRRNASLSSHNSRDRASPNVSTPGTPVSPSNLTATGATGGLGRSNTVPSNRSPAMPGTARFQRIADANQPSAAMSAHANSISGPVSTEQPGQETPTVPGTDIRVPSTEQQAMQVLESGAVGANNTSQMTEARTSTIVPQEAKPGQDPLMVAPLDVKSATRDRKISNLLSISPMFGPTDSSKDPNQRQPRKLQKRRIPGSSIESAQSSQASLNAEDTPAFQTPLATPNNMALDRNPVDSHAVQGQNPHSLQTTPEKMQNEAMTTSPTGPREQRNVNTGLMPPHSPSLSVHSRGSVTDPSDLDALEDPNTRIEKKRHRFTLSRAENTPLAPPPLIGQNAGARTSNSSLGSNRPRKSFTGESQTTQTSGYDASSASYPSAVNISSRESSEMHKDHHDPERKSFFGRIKAKVQQSMDPRERAKSPPRLQAEHGSRSSLSAFTQDHLSPRGRSFDKSQEGSLGVADERLGHQRTGSRTPVAAPPQWPSSVPGSAPASATPNQAGTLATAIHPPPGPASAPVSAAPTDPSLMPAPLQRRSQVIDEVPSAASAPVQESRNVPIPTPEPVPANPVRDTLEGKLASPPSGASEEISAHEEPVPTASQVEPAPAATRTSVHDQVAPLSAKSTTATPVEGHQDSIIQQSIGGDTVVKPTPAPASTSAVTDSLQPQQQHK